MPTIEKLVLRNFKKFEKLQLDFSPDLNLLLGDNEAGKSSVLLALELAMGGSRSKVEAVGIEVLYQLFADSALG